MMKSYIKIIIISMFASCCKKKEISSPWASFTFTDSEVLQLEKQFSLGDLEAAVNLYMYYSGVKSDREKAEYYLIKGAEMGHEGLANALKKISTNH